MRRAVTSLAGCPASSQTVLLRKRNQAQAWPCRVQCSGVLWLRVGSPVVLLCCRHCRCSNSCSPWSSPASPAAETFAMLRIQMKPLCSQKPKNQATPGKARLNKVNSVDEATGQQSPAASRPSGCVTSKDLSEVPFASLLLVHYGLRKCWSLVLPYPMV